MASYYYLISSLPALRSDSAMPVSYDRFLDMCRTAVSARVFENLRNLTLNSCEGPLLSQWGTFYRNMQHELNRRRRERLGKPFDTSILADYRTRACIDRAMTAPDPLAAEQIMLDAQFEYLDSLVGLHSFDNYVLYGYAVKLRLLERQGAFVKERGQAEFERLFEGIKQQIMSV